VIVYLDSSALVKLAVEETGAARVRALVDKAAIAATSPISRAEVAAGPAKATRVGFLDQAGAADALGAFRALWPDLVPLQLTGPTLARAESLAWEHGLRGDEAVVAALREARVQRSAAIYREIATHVSLARCQDAAFGELTRLLRQWFPRD